jgi:hypothetical protein
LMTFYIDWYILLQSYKRNPTVTASSSVRTFLADLILFIVVIVSVYTYFVCIKTYCNKIILIVNLKFKINHRFCEIKKSSKVLQSYITVSISRFMCQCLVRPKVLN